MAVLTRTVGRPLTLAALALAAAMMAVLIGTGTLRGAARAQDQAGAGRGCVGAFGAGDSTLRLVAAGRSREVLLHVPSVLVRAGGRAPLLVALHGWSSGAREFAAVTGLNAVADSPGVVVAYPRVPGTPAGWHFSGNPSPDRGAAAADLALFDALLRRLDVVGCVDPARVFVAGHSQGGGMAGEIACRRAGRLAGVAMISGEHFRLLCRLSRPIAVLSLHAVDDEVLPYRGGHVAPMPPDFPDVLAGRGRGGCLGEPRSMRARAARRNTEGRRAAHRVDRLRGAGRLLSAAGRRSHVGRRRRFSRRRRLRIRSGLVLRR